MKQVTITEQLNGDYFTLYDNALGTILREFDGLDYATVKESIDDVAGPFGSVYITSKHGKRIVNIKGDLLGADVFANRRLLVRALRQTGVIKLVKFTSYDDLELQFEAEVTKYLNQYNHKVHTFMIELTAPDWRLYSQEEVMQTMGVTSVNGGANIPFETIPVDIDATPPTGTESTNILINDGDEATDPVFTIYGPGTGFTIENNTSGKSIILSSTLVGGDMVVIDVKAGTIVKNGTDNLYPDFTGDFWQLLPGENELRFFVDADAEIGVTQLTVAYRHAYNGI